jgi:predicted Mrr-cat superfamily restriction endonuclease
LFDLEVEDDDGKQASKDINTEKKQETKKHMSNDVIDTIKLNIFNTKKSYPTFDSIMDYLSVRYIIDDKAKKTIK